MANLSTICLLGSAGGLAFDMLDSANLSNAFGGDWSRKLDTFCWLILYNSLSFGFLWVVKKKL